DPGPGRLGRPRRVHRGARAGHRVVDGGRARAPGGGHPQARPAGRGDGAGRGRGGEARAVRPRGPRRAGACGGVPRRGPRPAGGRHAVRAPRGGGRGGRGVAARRSRAHTFGPDPVPAGGGGWQPAAMPDRYADAVVARRRELRELRERLGGSHRGELRGCLALSRLTAARDAERALADLRREAAEHVRCGDRAARRRLPDLVAAAVDALAADAAARWAADLAPALRRIATERELAVGPGCPRLPAASPPGPPPTDEPAPDRPLLTRLVEGVALGRLALFPLAVLPLAGLPALGGPALAPLAVVVGLAALAVATCARRAAAER